ncbi:hypothetical protein A0256_10920 [Mucilaginibacter sp. PAMC 26640]|nr:hypothetical protein A0256_10920 [Mucilaginibacter sp. PAMC 26640]
MRNTLLIICSVFAIATAKGQTTEEVYDRYLDFNLARLEGRTNDAMELGEKLLPDTAKLTRKNLTNFYYSIGKLYEDDSQSVKALPYYERVAAVVPNYYVVQRALGYLYAKQADDLADEIKASAANEQESQRLTKLYNAKLKQALPYLEKAQACDPDDDTLSRIKTFYNIMKDEQGAANLENRLAKLSKNCIDLLEN